MDEARALGRLRDDQGMTQEEIAASIQKSRQHVSHMLALLLESSKTQAKLARAPGGKRPEGKVGVDHVLRVQTVGLDPKDREAVIAKAAREDLSASHRAAYFGPLDGCNTIQAMATLQRITIELTDGRQATLTDDRGWQSADAELRDYLETFTRHMTTRSWDPDPLHTLANQGAALVDAKIISADEPPPLPPGATP